MRTIIRTFSPQSELFFTITANDNSRSLLISHRYLAKHIPEMAQAAVKQACWQALASCTSVFVGENGVINEVFPDGTVKFVKNITPHTAKSESGGTTKENH